MSTHNEPVRILGFPRYLVTRSGSVIGPSGKQLKPKLAKDGYLSFSAVVGKYKTKTLLIARCVAAAFIPNPENKPQVNHINGVKADNRVENLEWATAKENCSHRNQVLGHLLGEKHTSSVLKEADIPEIRKMVAAGISFKKVGIRFGVSASCVEKIKNRTSWKHIK